MSDAAAAIIAALIGAISAFGVAWLSFRRPSRRQRTELETRDEKWQAQIDERDELLRAQYQARIDGAQAQIVYWQDLANGNRSGD